MIETFWVFAPMAVAFLGLWWVIYTTTPRVVIFFVIMSVSAFLISVWGAETLRGSPQLMDNETARPEVAEVLWNGRDKDDILLLLNWPGLKSPRYYRMSWAPSTEREIRQAGQEATARHTPLMLKHPFGLRVVANNKPSELPSGDGGVAAGGLSGGGTGVSRGEGSTIFYPAPPPPQEEKR
jgi:hypothetical protein